MVNQKFLTKGSAALDEEQAISTSAGGEDAGKIPCLNADGELDDSFMPPGVAAEVITAKAGSGGVTANDVVYLHMVDVDLTADPADASDGSKRAMGYVKDTTLVGDPVLVYLDGELPGSGFTPGATYFLSADTPGAVSASEPDGSGEMVQAVGVAISAALIKFDPNRCPIILV